MAPPLIFSQENAEKVLRGEKTVTRRPLPCRYLVGHNYAVQPGRGKKAVGRILIVKADTERLGDLGAEDAQAEGFASVAEFAAYWRSLYGGLDGKQLVRRLEFELVAE